MKRIVLASILVIALTAGYSYAMMGMMGGGMMGGHGDHDDSKKSGSGHGGGHGGMMGDSGHGDSSGTGDGSTGGHGSHGDSGGDMMGWQPERNGTADYGQPSGAHGPRRLTGKSDDER